MAKKTAAKKTSKPTKTPRTGRPPKPPGEKYKTTVRQLGRIADDEWDIIANAWRVAHAQSFTAWARGVLLAEAKKLKKISGDV